MGLWCHSCSSSLRPSTKSLAIPQASPAIIMFSSGGGNTQSICDLISSLSLLNARWLQNCCRLCTQIVNGRYLARITTIDKLFIGSQCNIAKDILDRLLHDLGMLDSD